MSWLSPWSYRRRIDISSSETTTNYQTKIVLNNTNFDFSKASSNDIRITASDGVSELSFWIESFSVETEQSVIWCKLSTLDTGNNYVYIYYGNTSSTIASNGDLTFLFFDSFSNSSWTALGNMPYSAADLAAATIGNKIYLVGGYTTPGSPIPTLYEYDTTTGIFTQKADMPTSRWGNFAVAVTGKIYSFGGVINGSYTGTVKNEMYDPLTNSWTTKEDLPAGIANQGITGCTDGTDIYLFYNGLSYVYSVSTGIYTQKANIPNHVLSWASCSYYNGNIYLIGGYSSGAKNYTQIYNIAANTWSSGTSCPISLYGAVRENTVINGKIYIIDGQNASGEFFSTSLEYNIANDSWSEKSMGMYAADGVAGGVVNNTVYIFGGRHDTSGPNGLNFSSKYTPSLDSNSNKWTTKLGGFIVSDGSLKRSYPSVGAIPSIVPQIVTGTYISSGDFVLELDKTVQNVNAWNTLAIHTNSGIYNSNQTGYLIPYIDYVSGKKISVYRENGTNFSLLTTKNSIASGLHRFTIKSTSSQLLLYIDGSLEFTCNDNTYRDGALSLVQDIAETGDTSLIFSRKYLNTEPTITVQQEETNVFAISVNTGPYIQIF